MNVSDTISYSLIIAPEWGKWSPAIFYRGASQWAYRPKEIGNSVDGASVDTAGFDPTHVRQTHYFSVWLDYNFNPWLTAEVGFWNEVSGIGFGGQRSNLFFDRYQDTRVYLGASIQLDNFVEAIRGEREGSAGIVRAKNTKVPMWRF
jgi:hypothetical protein